MKAAQKDYDTIPYTPEVVSAADLEVADLPALRWTVRDLLPQGMAVLAGRPKQGKSWLALQLGLAVARGANFLGFPVDRGDVLYLALEDSARRVQERVRALIGRGAPTALYVATEWRQWSEGGDLDLDAWLVAHPHRRLVIVDTWSRIAPSMRTRGDNYSEAYNLLSRLHGLARHYAVAIVIVTHTRKQNFEDSSPLDGVIGTTATTGCADTILVMVRRQKAQWATLHTTGRDIAARAVKITWTPTGWTVEQDPLIMAIEQIAMQCGLWEGTPTDLLAVIGERGKHPASLSRRLALLKSELEEVGVRIETVRDSQGRHIRVTSSTAHVPLTSQIEGPPVPE